MPAFFRYQFAISGTSTSQGTTGGAIDYSNEPPLTAGDAWSYDASFTPFLIEQANDGATTLLEDWFFFNETIPFYAQSGTANAQEVDIEGDKPGDPDYNPLQLVWDYSFEVQDPSDGTTYTISVIDVDLDGNNVIEGAENGYYLVFQPQPDGTMLVPPPDTNLVYTGAFTNNIFSISHAELGGEAVCFASGTTIETPDGAQPVETIKVGDFVMTRDGGPQSVRWAGWSRLFGYGKAAPVVIPKCALGNDIELVVSPQHAILLKDWRAELLFGTSEVLVRAIDLVGHNGIFNRPGGVVRYHHILLDQHHLIKAAGIWSESLYPGDVAQQTMGRKAREEINRLVPDLDAYGPKAAPCLRRFEVECLAA